MSENNGVVLQSIVGSSYEGKFKVVSPEISLNMFVEPIAADNESYTSKILKSIDGNEAVLYFGNNSASKTPNQDFTFGVGCRGLYTSTSSPDGVPYLYAVFDNNLWRIKPSLKADDCIKVGSIGATTQPVRFAESGGINSQLCIANNSTNTLICGTLDIDANVRLSVIQNPINPYNPNNQNSNPLLNVSPARSTHIVEMKNRILINDADYGQVFISRVGAFQGGTIKVYDLDSDGNIQYEDDGYTPIYKEVNANEWGWKDDRGAYMFYTPLSDTGDKVLAMECINNGTLFVFGERSYAILTMEDSEYQLKNTLMGNNIGIAAPQSLAKTENELCWLGSGDDGHNGIWSVALDGKPKKISTFALDREIQAMRKTDDAFGFGYNYAGHHFYVITFPSADKTFVYDFDTGTWHNRSTRDALLDIDHFWFPVFAHQFNGQVYLGNYENNCLMKVVPNKHTEWDGRPIRRLRRSPIITSELANFIVNEFRIECNVGTTEQVNPFNDMSVDHTGQVPDNAGYNPAVMARFSADGGNTWQALDDAFMGKTGEYNYLCQWLGLGMARMGVIEVSLTAPVDFVITSSKIRYTPTRGF
jgi:hypothetical protein